MPTIIETANASLLKKRLIDEIAGPTGPVGPAGAVGPAGVTGLQGITGATGPQGLTGLQGNTGIQGVQGVQGIQGNTGIQGITGQQGIQGVQGITGVTGIQGITGSQGVQGLQGNTGVQGQQGITGSQGLQGPQGNTGVQGQQGITGIQGVQGNQGPTGSTGPAGITGPQGLQGTQGPTGAMGATGMTGVQGPAGLQGPQGVTGFQGAQGNPGVTGIQGAVGITGAQGVQGNQGITGAQGVQGIQGIQGIQGVTGVQGVQGQQGITGVQGVQGIQGIQGIQGQQGITGIQGVQGNQGITGAQGAAGNQGITGVQGLTGIVGDTIAHHITIVNNGWLQAGVTGVLGSSLSGLNFSNTGIVGQSGGVDTFYIRRDGSYMFKGAGNVLMDPQNLYSDAKNLGRVIWQGEGPYSTTSSNNFANVIYYKLPYEKSLIFVATAYTAENDTVGNVELALYAPTPSVVGGVVTYSETKLNGGTSYYLSNGSGLFGSGKNSSCFWIESTIQMFDNSKRLLKELKIGDEVLSYNVQNKLYEKSTISGLKIIKVSGYFILLDGSLVTSDHLFYTPFGFMKLKEIAEDMEVLINNEWKKIGPKKFVNKELTVANISVDNNNNYIVNGYLVHNKPSPTQIFNPAVLSIDVGTLFGENYPSGNNSSHPNVIRIVMTVACSQGAANTTVRNVLLLASRNLAIPPYYGETLV